MICFLMWYMICFFDNVIHDLFFYVLIFFDMIWYVLIWFDMFWYVLIFQDLKPSNLLLASNGSIKIADFGLAKMYGSPNHALSPQACTRWYRAPELLFGARSYGTGMTTYTLCIYVIYRYVAYRYVIYVLYDICFMSDICFRCGYVVVWVYFCWAFNSKCDIPWRQWNWSIGKNICDLGNTNRGGLACMLLCIYIVFIYVICVYVYVCSVYVLYMLYIFFLYVLYMFYICNVICRMWLSYRYISHLMHLREQLWIQFSRLCLRRREIFFQNYVVSIHQSE